jgi:hypothetical protein
MHQLLLCLYIFRFRSQITKLFTLLQLLSDFRPVSGCCCCSQRPCRPTAPAFFDCRGEASPSEMAATSTRWRPTSRRRRRQRPSPRPTPLPGGRRTSPSLIFTALLSILGACTGLYIHFHRTNILATQLLYQMVQNVPDYIQLVTIRPTNYTYACSDLTSQFTKLLTLAAPMLFFRMSCLIWFYHLFVSCSLPLETSCSVFLYLT